jgi:hypothetical protein
VLVGFIGDVHGQVFDMIAALLSWQQRTAVTFDFLVQVGDIGACPSIDRMDAASKRYLAAFPAQADFSRLLAAQGGLAERLRSTRESFARPIHFIRGNHEDSTWLRRLPVDPAASTARVDPFGLLRYVPDGTLLSFGSLKIGFLGGADDDDADGAIDRVAWESLMDLGPGQIDVLVTHDAPYGISTGYHGQVQGSPLITQLIERVQPSFHVAGHLSLNGPRAFGRTTFLCLSGLVESSIWNPSAHGLSPGCLAVLDTAAAMLSPVTESWLANFDTPVDFGS